MPEFSYTARRTSGEKITGSLMAASEREVINMLSQQKLFPIEVAEEKKRKAFRLGGLNAQTMAIFYSQMAGLLRAGVPLLKSLKILSQQSSHPKLTEVLTDIHDRVEDGEPVGDAMGRYPKIFNTVAVNMARAGAEGGFLEDALDRVSKFTEQQADLKARTVGAMIYPIILGTVGTLIVTVLLIFFVPKFGEMFDQLREKGALPVFTDWLLAFSGFLGTYWPFIAAAMIIAAVVYFVSLQSEKGKRFRDTFKIKVPLFGNIIKNLAVARFCRVLGTLLGNGVPILKSLEISRHATANIILSDAIEQATENITSGESLAQPLSKSGHFPTTVVEMITVAEESNTLDTVLVDIADGLEKRTSRRLDLLVRMLEPMMLLLMAGIVLVVVIALLLPVIKMSQIMQ